MKSLIMLPGLGTTKALFGPLISYLESDFSCLAFDLIGADTIEAYAKNCLDNSPKHFYLLGHSLGGGVAQVMAALAPERIERLILMNTWCLPDPILKQRRQLMVEKIKSQPSDQTFTVDKFAQTLNLDAQRDLPVINALIQMRKKLGMKNYSNQLQALIAIDDHLLAFTQKIQCPTLIIHGQQDSVFNISQQLALQKNIVNSKLEIIPTCGHITPLEKTESSANIIINFC